MHVRSALADDLKVYYEAVMDRLDVTRWPSRDGGFVRASAIAIPARVLKEETRAPARERGTGAGERGEDREDPARGRVDPAVAIITEERGRDTRPERVTVEAPWSKERPNIRRAMVKGAPGGGKSFLSDRMAVELAQEGLDKLRDRAVALESLPLPVHLELEQLEQDGLPEDLPEAILAAVGRSLKPVNFKFTERLSKWIMGRVPSQECWLILDALDQAEHRPGLTARIAELGNWQCRAVITCRTANYHRSMVPWQQLTEYELAPLNPSEEREFVQRWFGSDPRRESLTRALDGNYSLSHACRTPLILTFACLTHHDTAVHEETRRVDLYAAVLIGLASRAWRSNQIDQNATEIDDFIEPLPELALVLFLAQPSGNLFLQRDVGRTVKRPPPRMSPEDYRDELISRGILVKAGRSPSNPLQTQLSFAHRSILEYLAARAIADRVEADGWKSARMPGNATMPGGILFRDWIEEQCQQPACQEVIAFLAGMLENPEPLLTLLADEESDDLFRHRAALGARCLAELSRGARDGTRTLVDRITTAVFSTWIRWQEGGKGSLVEHLARVLGALVHAGGRVRSPDGTLRLVKVGRRYKDRHVRNSGAEAPGVVDALLALLGDKDWNVRSAAAQALGLVGLGVPGVVDALFALLGDQDSDVRSAAARALGRLMDAGWRVFGSGPGRRIVRIG